MHRFSFILFFCLYGLCFSVCVPSLAQAAATQLKPGLWEHQTRIDAPPDALVGQYAVRQALAQLPAGQREVIRKQLKQTGIDMDLTGDMSRQTMRMCLTAEDIGNNFSKTINNALGAGCQQQLSRKGDTYVMTYKCTAPMPSEGHGEYVLKDSENYAGKMTLSLPSKGLSKNSTVYLQGRWLGADCAGLLPISQAVKGVQSAAPGLMRFQP